MNVLSLFDGMSCGRIALERAGVKVDKYFASEVDKYAISIAKKNYPDTIHLGDVRDVWWPESTDGHGIDLLIGGSPCQGFSFAGQQLNFDDPRSQLFFEYVRILKECKPKYFLLENVKMKKESEQVITDLLGVEPIEINSNLVSAQNRRRLYWTNLPVAGLPEDKGIVLADILEHGLTDREKAHCIDANYWKGGNLKSYFEKHRRQLVFSEDGLCHAIGKSPTLNVMTGGNIDPKAYVLPYQWRKLTPLECERLQTVPDGYTAGVSNTQRYRMLGNGWTVDVIAHLLQGIVAESHGQLELEGVA